MGCPVMSLLIPNVVSFLLHDILKLFFQGVVCFSSDVPQDILAIPNLDKDALQATVMVVILAKIAIFPKIISKKKLNNYKIK